MKKLVKESLNESLNETLKEYDIIEVKVRKDSGENLKEILDCIKNCGNVGHTFNVVVDPDEKEGLEERKFCWDGDGSDYIESVVIK